jgi:hypothetical protein
MYSPMECSSRRAAGVSPLFGGITHGVTNAITIIAPRENRTAENAVRRGGLSSAPFQSRHSNRAIPIAPFQSRHSNRAIPIARFQSRTGPCHGHYGANAAMYSPLRAYSTPWCMIGWFQVIPSIPWYSPSNSKRSGLHLTKLIFAIFS